MSLAVLPQAEQCRLAMLQRALDDAADELELAVRERDIHRLQSALGRCDQVAAHVAEFRRAYGMRAVA